MSVVAINCSSDKSNSDRLENNDCLSTVCRDIPHMYATVYK